MKRVIFFIFMGLATTLLAQGYSTLKKEAYATYKSGDKQKAITQVERYIAMNPQSYQAKNLLSVLYYWKGDLQQAQKLLREIVAHVEYPEAASLLRKVTNKLGNSSYKDFHQFTQKSQMTDLEYLVKEVDANPMDVENRVLLSKFYFNNNEFQKAYDMAHEVLEINPKNRKMLKITQALEKDYKLSYSATIDENSALDKNKAKELLKKLYREKNYNAYFNLYKALEHAHVYLSKKMYVNALYVAIMIGEYDAAQAIIKKGVLPVNKHILKVQLLLSKKLSHQVASR